jgi:phage terminase large subunit-like protein
MTALAQEELVDEEALNFKLTSKQEEAIELLSSDAIYYLLYGGSRSTKTFTAVRSIVIRALASPNSRHAILRFRFNHVKASIVYDTFPKVMRLCFPECPFKLNKEDWFVRFPNGSEIWFGGLDDKERTEKILGREYATIMLNEVSQISYDSFLMMITRLAQKCFYTAESGEKKMLRLKMYLDENPPTKGHWSHKLFINKVEPKSKRPIENPEDYDSILMNPVDNLENLPDAYIKALQRLPKMKRDRFWAGKFADDDQNALFSPEIFEANRVDAIPPEALPFVRIVVAVDPSGADEDENVNNDDIGIGVAALGSNGVGYTLEDLTTLGGPKKWGGVVASAYQRHKADRVVGETNYGGAMVKYVVQSQADTIGVPISFKAVTASRGKTVRAEPISALLESGKIKQVGQFEKLEDELCGFTTTGYIGEKSPNRGDWYVWAYTELFPGLAAIEEEEENYYIPTAKRI